MAEKRKVANLMALAVLATVVQRPMHRYEMASVMRARGKDRDMDIKLGSLYTVVQNLERNGYLHAIGVTRQGARPERTVYQITDAGREELVSWTRELIAEPEAEHTRFVAGLSVLAVLTPQDVIDLLRRRLERERAANPVGRGGIRRARLVDGRVDTRHRQCGGRDGPGDSATDHECALCGGHDVSSLSSSANSVGI